MASRARSRHRKVDNLVLYGQAVTRSLASRAAMNLATHRFEAEIKTGRPILDDPFHVKDAFDAVLVESAVQ